MLRLLIGTGVLLMVVGFGAAGWQYWQSLPPAAAVAPAETVPEAARPASQSWLISPTGGLVPQQDVRAYLDQGRFVPGRTLVATLQAPLAALLTSDESLPAPAYLQVLADIRAPMVAKGLCETLKAGGAAACALQSARVVEGSVNAEAGTADFRIELVYRLPSDAEDLPDLAAHVLDGEVVSLELEAGAEGTASADAALAALIAAADSACAEAPSATHCRPVGYWLDWAPGQPVSARARIGWLAPLPEGMLVAPPLDPAG